VFFFNVVFYVRRKIKTARGSEDLEIRKNSMTENNVKIVWPLSVSNQFLVSHGVDSVNFLQRTRLKLNIWDIKNWKFILLKYVAVGLLERTSVLTGSTTLDRKRIYANPSSYPYPNSNTNPNPLAQ